MLKSDNKILFIEPYFGISGDMFLGALLSFGADTKEFFTAIKNFKTNERYNVSAEKTERCGFEALSFKVKVFSDTSEQHHHHHGKTLDEIKDIINSNKLMSLSSRKKAIKLFAKLADAERKVHYHKEHIHFHEVGAVDSIVDICGAVLALEILGIEKIYSTPINVGHGTAKTAHGLIPLPSPAAAELLKGIPVFSKKELPEFEFTTPTGALLASELCEFRSDSEFKFRIIKTAYGAGKANFKNFPNILRASIRIEEESDYSDTVFVIETLIDDATGEELSYLKEKIIESGALECTISSVLSKKGRPAQLITAICKKELFSEISDIILTESSSNGLRFREEKRKMLQRFSETVSTPFGKIPAKFTVSNNIILKVKAEHDAIIELVKNSKSNYISLKKQLESFLNSKFIGKKYERKRN